MWRRISTSLEPSLSSLLHRRIHTGSHGRFVALWGNGDYGRLGLGSLQSQWKPAVCPAFDDDSPRAIACGGAHTLFLTEKGRVFATGLNDYGQLGVASEQNYELEPLEVSGFPKEIIRVAASFYHSAAITVDGELYVWGNNSSGQLGLGKRANKRISAPTKVESLGGLSIKMIALGSEHSIAVTGDILSWGAGGSGRLGHGHRSNIMGLLRSTSEYTPRLIKEFEGLKFSTGTHSKIPAYLGAISIFACFISAIISLGIAFAIVPRQVMPWTGLLMTYEWTFAVFFILFGSYLRLIYEWGKAAAAAAQLGTSHVDETDYSSNKGHQRQTSICDAASWSYGMSMAFLAVAGPSLPCLLGITALFARLGLIVAGGLVLASFMTYASEHLSIRAFVRGLEDPDIPRARNFCLLC